MRCWYGMYGIYYMVWYGMYDVNHAIFGTVRNGVRYGMLWYGLILGGIT